MLGSTVSGPFVGLFLMAVMLPFVNSKVRKKQIPYNVSSRGTGNRI